MFGRRKKKKKRRKKQDTCSCESDAKDEMTFGLKILGLPSRQLNEPIYSWLCMSFVGCLILLLHLLSIVVDFFKGSR